MVLLIRPFYIPLNSKNYDLSLPLGLLSLATALENNGISVKIVDSMSEPDFLYKIESGLKEADFVGITAMTVQVKHGIEIAKFVKEKRYDLPIVWGGFHPTIYPEGTLQSEYCDYVAVGEADKTIVKFYNAFKAGNSLKGVKGLWGKFRGVVYFTGHPDKVFEIPLLNYNLIENLEDYIEQNLYPIEIDNRRCLQIHAGRGCFYKCTFCAENIDFQHRSKTAQKLIDEIEYLSKKYRLDYVDLQDSDFFSDKKRTIEFIDLLIKKNLKIKWFTNCRANYFNSRYINYDFLKRIEIANCKRIGIGVESGSKRMLVNIKKAITIPLIKQAINDLNKTDIIVSFSFMIGMPGETIEDMWDTLAMLWYIENNCKRYYIIGPALYRPYPGSKMFNDAVALGYKSPILLDQWAETEFDFFGFISESYLPYLNGKFKVLHYVRHVVDYRHLRKHEATFILYCIFNFIVKLRIKYHLHFLILEHIPLKWLRFIIMNVKRSLGILKKI